MPLTPSALLAGDEIYFVSDNGIATCLDAKTGREHWRSRLSGMFSASPVFAGGRIYFLDEDGRTTIIKPGTTFRELAMNEIDGPTLASIAVIGKIILLRSETHSTVLKKSDRGGFFGGQAPHETSTGRVAQAPALPVKFFVFPS